ncbi:MAG: hypothetical protein HS128_22820 [Ideonella sp.]|nr:hypothetical protein [Ideonella sp.]MCC7457346.1 hypothetical protein [Nitrospira sp.]
MMSLGMRLAVGVSALLIASHGTWANRNTPHIQAASVYRYHDSIFVDGYLLPGVDDRIIKIVEHHSISKIVIRSGGGDTGTALNIAELIAAKRIDIVVRDHCISSCANYIFIAGEKKHIMKNSIVALHGGHSDQPYDTCDERQCVASREMGDLLRREQRLYAAQNVSLDLIVYSGWAAQGKPTGKKTIVEVQGLPVAIEERVARFSHWLPDRKTFEACGVRGISATSWFPESAEEAIRVLKQQGITTASPLVGRKIPLFL